MSMAAQMLWGASLGALVGGAGGWAASAMKARKRAAVELGDEAPHLVRDMQLAEMVSRFRKLSEHSDATRTLFSTLVMSTDEMMRLCAVEGDSPHKGTAPIKANRLASAAGQAARQLCKVAFDVHRDENAPLLADDVESLEWMLNGHLHNVML